MIRTAGRYRIPLREAWGMRPGEFYDYVAGAAEGERDSAFMQALICTYISAGAGVMVDPRDILGEEHDDKLTTGDPSAAAQQVYDKAVAASRAEKQRIADAWLPKGVEVHPPDER